MPVLGDAVLTGKIKTALLMDERIGATGINVTTVNGVVTLEGTVDSSVQRRLAADVAVLNGAEEVRNLLEVDGEPLAPPAFGPVASGAFGHVTTPEGAPPSERAELQKAVQRALAADQRVNEHLIHVEVVNNTVFLSGRQGDVDARNAAVEIASHVPGVAAVEDDLEIMPAV